GLGGGRGGRVGAGVGGGVSGGGFVVVIRVAVGRGADPWLRLTAWATLAQQGVGLFFLTAGRYYYLTWLLTLLIVAAWVHGEGLDLVRRRFPDFAARSAENRARVAAAGVLARMARVLALPRARS